MNDFVKFWPIITWIIATAFAVGMIYWKVESARGALKLLFEKIGELEKHQARHCAENEALKEMMIKMEKENHENRQETNTRYAALIIRVDQIFSLLTELQKKG